jgi:sister-chromatid-cohesion protein PDS5
MTEVKSIVLLADLDNAEPLIVQLFASFFDIMSGSSIASTGEQLSKNVEINMATLLVTVVDEASSLPPEVVDIIVAQFLRADPRSVTSATSKGKKGGLAPVIDDKQSTLLLKELPPAYNMAKEICNSCPRKMARYISQYFNDIIMDASSVSKMEAASKGHTHRRASDVYGDSDDEDVPKGPTEEDLKELYKAHKLLRELWRAAPPVLQNVIPQLEQELLAENVQLRLLATETLGDIISGIGAAGPPPAPVMDPAAYPQATMASHPDSIIPRDVLTTPSSSQSFAQTHPAAYNHFLGRARDKSAVIRSGWTTAIGRIIMTSAGGVGLSQSDEKLLIKNLAEKLNDSDERVRLAAVKAVGSFGLRDIVIKLGSIGDVTKPGSVLNAMADRARDRKHPVRVEAMRTLGRIWGVAAGEIAAGNETVMSMLGAIPSKIFEAYYINEQDLYVLMDHVVFELMIPLSYPPFKSKPTKASNGDSQTTKDSQVNGDKEKESLDADKIRAERILLMVKSLDTKARKAFVAFQTRQPTYSKAMEFYLKKCEEFNVSPHLHTE